jgi:glycyl-tRNA synthetase beta subunit
MESAASDFNQSEWKKLVQQALVEPNPDKLKEKVADAESAIFQRLQALERSSESSVERHALQDASNTLLTLKREVLKYPDWKPE